MTRSETSAEIPIVRAAAAEFVGTLGVVVFGTGAVIAAGIGLDATGVALGSGLAVAVMITATYRISGGQLNPAVTLGLLGTGGIDVMRALVYLFAQLLGAIAGAFLLRGVMPGIVYDAAGGGVPAVAPNFELPQAIVVEALLAFFWVLAYMTTARGRREPETGVTGVTIGLLVAAGVFVFGSFTGAVGNPARWIGSAFAAGIWTDWYVWLIGPLVGGIVGAVVARALVPRSPEGVEARR